MDPNRFLGCGYDRVIDMSLRLLKNQVEYNARERAIHITLREISSLGDQILANHSSELDKLDTSTKNKFMEGRRYISLFRSGSLCIYWKGLSEGSLGDPRQYRSWETCQWQKRGRTMSCLFPDEQTCVAFLQICFIHSAQFNSSLLLFFLLICKIMTRSR
jgi:hypothetical protein